MRLPTQHLKGPQDGFAMIQVMVAMAILGILVVAFSGMIAQTVKAQRIARVQGEKLSLQTIFRGSLTCSTKCEDLKRDIPDMVGQWKVKPICSSKKLVLNVSHPGPLAINIDANYKLSAGESFVIVRAERIIGTYTNAQKTIDIGQYSFQVIYQENKVILRVAKINKS